jgi:hypothetical protein
MVILLPGKAVVDFGGRRDYFVRYLMGGEFQKDYESKNPESPEEEDDALVGQP